MNPMCRSVRCAGAGDAPDAGFEFALERKFKKSNASRLCVLVRLQLWLVVELVCECCLARSLSKVAELITNRD
jgi:hypothetical protein